MSSPAPLYSSHVRWAFILLAASLPVAVMMGLLWLEAPIPICAAGAVVTLGTTVCIGDHGLKDGLLEAGKAMFTLASVTTLLGVTLLIAVADLPFAIVNNLLTLRK
ncbi:MAG: hypothetical protein ABI634_10830 [Acidobacteriota bacterium]